MTYFEIICQSGVIGVCSKDGMLQAAKEDRVLEFGLISRDAFDRFGDAPWEEPISRHRWKPEVIEDLKLEYVRH